MMKAIDVTVQVRPGMIVYEGDPDISLERASSIADGAICNVSRLDAGVHTGTHIDAPVHFIEGAAGIEDTPLDALMGSVYVVDATEVATDISKETLERLELPIDAKRVLFKTPNSQLWAHDRFSADFVGLTQSAAEYLVRRGVQLVGIDYLSIAPKSDPAPTHVTLLGAGVVILEGADLRAVEPGWYRLLCLPLLLVGSDGAPARTILIRE
jgi:arylformamidase